MKLVKADLSELSQVAYTLFCMYAPRFWHRGRNTIRGGDMAEECRRQLATISDFVIHFPIGANPAPTSALPQDPPLPPHQMRPNTPELTAEGL